MHLLSLIGPPVPSQMLSALRCTAHSVARLGGKSGLIWQHWLRTSIPSTFHAGFASAARWSGVIVSVGSVVRYIIELIGWVADEWCDDNRLNNQSMFVCTCKCRNNVRESCKMKSNQLCNANFTFEGSNANPFSFQTPRYFLDTWKAGSNFFNWWIFTQ